MRKPKKTKRHSPKKSLDWIEYIENGAPRLVVPVGPRFQVTVPEWSGLYDEKSKDNSDGDLDDSRSGKRMWTINEESSRTGGCDKIGKGRPDSCACTNPGSVECVNSHIAEERKMLRCELGPAFDEWKFDTMGEEVSESWTYKEQKKFEFLVRTNPPSQDRTFLKPALTSFPSKTREEIVNYYLNVYVPRRISQQTRSGSLVLDTDDEAETTINAKASPKRSRPQNANNSKQGKPRYLAGRR